MTRHFATACRAAQLPVLFMSMLRHCQPFKLHVLAWDWDMSAFDGRRRQLARVAPETALIVTSREAFLARHPDHAPERLPGPPRSVIDQVCTVRWTFLCDVMEATGAPVTLIDGDIWFWSSPEPMFEEIGGAGVALTLHAFAPAAAGLPGVTLYSHGKYGVFNGGFTYWADLAPARRMAELTRRWNYSDFLTHPDGRVTYGDQGQLELIWEEFNVHVIRHTGVNVAPWNVHTHPLEVIDGVVHFHGRPLIAYHFSSLRISDGRVQQIADPGYEVSIEQERILYAPYVAEFTK